MDFNELMNTETLKREEMESLKKLADLNLLISDANTILARLETTKTDYLKLREKKALEQIEELFKGSGELLENTHKNYEEISVFCNTVASYKVFLDENYTKFKEMLTDFQERSELWDARYGEQVGELNRQREKIKKDGEEIEKGRNEVKEAKEQIRKDRIIIEDQRQTLSRAIERLKEGKI